MSQNTNLPTMWWIIKGDLNIVMNPDWPEPELAIVIKPDPGKSIQLSEARLKEIEEMKGIGLGEWAEIYLPWGPVAECLKKGYCTTSKAYNRHTDVASHFDLNVEGEDVIIHCWYSREHHQQKEKGRVRIRRVYPKALLAEKATAAWERLDKCWKEERAILKGTGQAVEQLHGLQEKMEDVMRSWPAAHPQINLATTAFVDLMRLLVSKPKEMLADDAKKLLLELVDHIDGSMLILKGELIERVEARKRTTIADQQTRQEQRRLEEEARKVRQKEEAEQKATEPNVPNEAPKPAPGYDPGVDETTATENETSGDATTGTEEQLAKAPENDNSSAEESQTEGSDEAPPNDGDAKTASAPEGNLEQPPATPPADLPTAPKPAARKAPTSKQQRIIEQAAAGQVSGTPAKKPAQKPPAQPVEKKGLSALAAVVASAPNGGNGVSKS